jgi:hypothetical protein
MWLQIEEIAQRDRASELKDQCAGRFALPAFDGEWVVDGHIGISVRNMNAVVVTDT